MVTQAQWDRVSQSLQRHFPEAGVRVFFLTDDLFGENFDEDEVTAEFTRAGWDAKFLDNFKLIEISWRE